MENGTASAATTPSFTNLLKDTTVPFENPYPRHAEFGPKSVLRKARLMGCDGEAVKGSDFRRRRSAKEFHLLLGVKSTGFYSSRSGLRRRCPQQPAIRCLQSVEAHGERRIDAGIVDQASSRAVGHDLAAIDH